ncbi:hypothetical protein ASD38_00005 [Caulobacter sp. Root487D2Y]|uniref:hypothetical protein n=1 Tax=Caulobacter sp. Root487D2Y TaxID=1736547 RepID=UPI0006F64785|nr:hypothetical protein [Caulobacter sp. Root487D2Y]KQY34999.1 hypothetical protein ASD38_00005 [Caulobacter sp. Root487D2Y]
MRTKMPPAFSATMTSPDGVYELAFRPLDECDGVVEVTIAGEAMSWYVVRGDEEEDGTVSLSGMTVGSDVIWGDQFWFELVLKPGPVQIKYWGDRVLWRSDTIGASEGRPH